MVNFVTLRAPVCAVTRVLFMPVPSLVMFVRVHLSLVKLGCGAGVVTVCCVAPTCVYPTAAYS